MRRLIIPAVFILAAVMSFGCAITHVYGPYMGRVVELESGKPIEGAVVFLQFYIQVGNIGGYSSHFVDAVEVMTDSNGEFHIPARRINSFRFRFLSGWQEAPTPVVFKPGYGVFPSHRLSSARPRQNWFQPNRPVLIKLPRLKTRKERKENLYNIPNIEAPEYKYGNLRRLEREETEWVFSK